MDHEHRYFMFESKATFEPIANPVILNVSDGSAATAEPHRELYKRIEYAIMACNCGEAKKVKIKPEGEGEI